MLPKILIASVVHQRPEVFDAFLRALAWQSADALTSHHFVLDPSDPNAQTNALAIRERLPEATVARATPKPEGATYGVSETTHHWSVPTFHWLAQQKQRILDLAREERYDAVWLVDSDLLCAPATLASLLATGREIVSGVFWTHWTPSAPPLPQVWLAHPYEFTGLGVEAPDFLDRLVARDLVRVAGLGACTLIRTSVLDRVGYWPLVPDLPAQGMWQGEDRHFCVHAERAHIDLWADAWPDILHVYRPDEVDLERELERLRERAVPEAEGATVGDLISATIEPCEEPKLLNHSQPLRGRLGALPVLPALEAALAEMRVGDERFVPVRFPSWHPIASYGGRERLFRVRLLDAKVGAPLPPTLAPFLAPERDLARVLEPFIERTDVAPVRE